MIIKFTLFTRVFIFFTVNILFLVFRVNLNYKNTVFIEEFLNTKVNIIFIITLFAVFSVLLDFEIDVLIVAFVSQS